MNQLFFVLSLFLNLASLSHFHCILCWSWIYNACQQFKTTYDCCLKLCHTQRSLENNEGHTHIFLHHNFDLNPVDSRVGGNGFGIGSTLYCYQCISTHPGCGTPFEWIWHWSQACPEVDDKCVKLVERKGATEVITRDCLSSLKSIRTDIPADHYEGCRPATVDVHLANYVNNTIKELDIKKNYYDETTWCFCFLDNRCNGAMTGSSLSPLIFLTTLLSSILFF